ncbi:MAG TPA: hypothetical protein VG934_01705 [Candidatus Paceibacterota bacterium]|nr:hypothetical protein [Candidatus Paceibacterota bacterium]
MNLLVSTEQDPPVSAVNTDWSATDDDGPVIVGQGDAIICLDEDGEDQTCHAFMTWAEAEEYAQSNQDAGVYPLLGGSIMPLVIDDPLWYIHTLALIERSAHFDTTDPYAPPAPPTPMIASATGN